jgi:hypothetical protein
MESFIREGFERSLLIFPLHGWELGSLDSHTKGKNRFLHINEPSKIMYQDTHLPRHKNYTKKPRLIDWLLASRYCPIHRCTYIVIIRLQAYRLPTSFLQLLAVIIASLYPFYKLSVERD